MPAVLTINSTMNQARSSFLPARHRAIPFHAIVHTTTRGITSHSTIKFGKNGHTQSIGIFHPLFCLTVINYKQFHLQLGNLGNYTVRLRKLFSEQLLKSEQAGGKLSQLHYVAGDDTEQEYAKAG